MYHNGNTDRSEKCMKELGDVSLFTKTNTTSKILKLSIILGI